VAVVQLGRVVAGLEVVRERDAPGPDRGQFLAPLGDQLVVVDGGDVCGLRGL
jgi:hypothetical protein